MRGDGECLARSGRRRRCPGATARLGLPERGDGLRREVDRLQCVRRGGLRRDRRHRGLGPGLGSFDVCDRVGPVVGRSRGCRRRGIRQHRLGRRLCGSDGVCRRDRVGRRDGVGGRGRVGRWRRIRGGVLRRRRIGRRGRVGDWFVRRRRRRGRVGRGGGRGGRIALDGRTGGVGCGRRGGDRGLRRRDGLRGVHRHGQRHGQRRDSARRQQRERVDVPLRLRGDADAEVDGRIGRVRRRADGAHGSALRDRRPPRDGDRAEVDERDRKAVRRHHRHHAAAVRHGAGERDQPARRSDDALAERTTHVDAAVLSAGERMGRVERERTQHGPARRPGPGARGRSGAERKQNDEQHGTTHRAISFVVRLVNGETTVAAVSVVVQSDYSEPW